MLFLVQFTILINRYRYRYVYKCFPIGFLFGLKGSLTTVAEDKSRVKFIFWIFKNIFFGQKTHGLGQRVKFNSDQLHHNQPHKLLDHF